MTVDRDALQRAGLNPPRAVSDTEREYNEQITADQAKRGKPHGLSAEEVDFADRTGTPLHRYAAAKGVSNLDEWHAAQRQAAISEEAARDVQLEEARRTLRG